MRKIELIRARIKLKKELQARGHSKEEAKQILTDKGYYPNEEYPKQDNKGNTTNFKDNLVKIYCFQCKKMIKVIECQISKKEIKPNSYRYFLTGKCFNCGRHCSGLVKKAAMSVSTMENRGQ